MSRTKKGTASPPGVEPLVSVEAVAAWLDVSADTVHTLCECHRLPFQQVGKRRKFQASKVQAWIEDRTTVLRAGESPDAPPPAKVKAARGRRAGDGRRAPLDIDGDLRKLRELERAAGL